jgi:hypothetical protein
MLGNAARLIAFALFPLAAWAADELLLAPGKSVTVVDGKDPAVRIGGNVQSLATMQQARPAAGMVQNPDGSISLGAALAPREGRVIQSGVVVVHRGSFEVQEEAPGAERRAVDPIVDYTFGRDNVALPPQLSSIRTRVPPAVVPNLPAEMRKAQ